MKRFLMLLILTSLIGVFMTSCSADNNEAQYPFYTTDAEVFEIETDYCDLCYPMTWKNQVYISIEEDDFYSVKFFATVESDKIPLFNINFGGNEGTPIGTLTTGNREVDVFVESHNIDKDDYSEVVYKDLCGMSEDINVIISKLIESYDFILEQ